MGKHTKLWASMQAVTIASITVLSACEKSNEPGTDNAAPSHTAGHVAAGGEGEGEGASSGMDLSTDDLAYLAQLGLMRGHLLVGYELYQAGHIEHAKTHMKHPKSELYADAESAFASRGATGFADELSALTAVVTGEQDGQTVSQAYAALVSAIASNEAVVDESNSAATAKLKLVMTLLRVAGEEYAIAAVDGKMENAHEYQDAYGFTQVAKSVIASVEAQDDQTSETVAKASKILSDLDPLWPGLIPPDTLETEASALYGAAAQIEILALGLE